ncbi:unnamed protein product [Oikopleura dioica]|uniref:H15 domain-containing protein n=1 Tax=Oikopleura dioica TaxID=34765 RepID=E4XR80_OIKDI|nr:unnamed protein product [Oikopleura dioica]
MPASPKKETKVVAKKADRPSYNVMVAAAIVALKERSGSSRQAIEKYIIANYDGVDKGSHFLKKALKSGVEKGTLVQTKGIGASGSFKIKKAEKPAAKPKVEKPAAKKPAAKKPAAEKPAAKKPAAKKTTATKKPVAKKVVKKTVKAASPIKKAASPKKKVVAKKPIVKKTAKKTGKK